MSLSPRPADRQWLLGIVLPLALLGLHAALAVSSLTFDSLTFDELGHLTGGAASWRLKDHRMFPQNGQFPRRWAALGPLLVDAQLPSVDQAAWRNSDVDRFGHQFLYSTGNDLRSLLLASRLLMVVLELGLGLTIYLWSRFLFGRPGGLVSLTLFTFSPALLAHGRLATSDTAAALAFLLALLSLWKLLHRITILRVAGCSLSVGLLLVSKMSGLLILPIAAMLLVLRLAGRRPLHVDLPSYTDLVRSPARQLTYLLATGVVVAAGAVTILWGAYDFRFSAFHRFDPTLDRFFQGESIDQLTNRAAAGPVIRLARDHRLLPEAYLFGLAHVLRHSEAHPAFMRGEYSLRGWWQFHPYAVLVKTPMPVFIVAALAVWAALARPSTGARFRVPVRWRPALYRTAPLWLFLAVYWAAALRVHLSIGERHVLPTYPAAFILCGAAGHWISRRQRIVSGILVAALAWLAVESLCIWPSYLSYFNVLAGGPRLGYRHLVDSSCDWGQDLDRLRTWLEDRRRTSEKSAPVYVAYFGSADPAKSGIEATLLPCYLDWREQLTLERLQPGTYVISATMLQSVYNPAFGPWNREYERLFREYAALVRDSYGRPLPLDALHTARQRGLSKLAYDFERLRSARLFATLRTREPDDRVGHSLLVFEVSAAELHNAVDGW